MTDKLREAAYDQIDRFLRNNLHDDDYADYSAALESLYTAPTPPAQRVMLTDDEWFEFWDKCQAIPSDSSFPEFLQIARAVIEAYEKKNGIK